MTDARKTHGILVLRLLSKVQVCFTDSTTTSLTLLGAYCPQYECSSCCNDEKFIKELGPKGVSDFFSQFLTKLKIFSRTLILLSNMAPFTLKAVMAQRRSLVDKWAQNVTILSKLLIASNHVTQILTFSTLQERFTILY